MPVCTKNFVQYGTEAASVYTIMLDRSNFKQHSLVLARMALEAIANNKGCAKNSDCLCRVAQALREAASSNFVSKETSKENAYVAQPNALDVHGTLVRVHPNTTVVYGTAVCCVRDKKMDTGIPVVHASMILDGVQVAVTSVLRQDFAHTRSALHFISSGDNKCVNVRALQLGRRSELSVVWQPMLSHFLRRANTTALHTASFRNLGLPLQHTKHAITPLCDVVESSSGQYLCFSIFI
jgi:hypothetical protein